MNIKDLKRITDFDFGVGGPIENCVRVSSLGDENVSASEVNLILWLLVEQEFGHSTKNKTKSPENVAQPEEKVGDEADSKKTVQLFVDGLSRPQKLQARQYTEELLRCVGVNVPFELLNESEKQNLFGQFCASSELLLTEKFTSILDLYETLRRRSKFREQFEILGTLGKGKFGTALKVKLKHNDVSSNSGNPTTFAIKRIHLTIDSLGDIKMILNESAILKTLNVHPNVVQFYDSWLAMDTREAEENVNCAGSTVHQQQQDDDDSLVFYLQMELCGQSLHQWKTHFKSNYNFDERKCLSIAQQLANGLEWIHSHNFLHLDINPKNIFWSDDSCETLKIGDFGLSVRGEFWNGRRGTLPYCAPEQQMTRKSDVYSIGVTLFEMTQVFNTRTELLKRLEKREFATGSAILDEILRNLLETDPSKRWSCSQLSSALL